MTEYAETSREYRLRGVPYFRLVYRGGRGVPELRWTRRPPREGDFTARIRALAVHWLRQRGRMS